VAVVVVAVRGRVTGAAHAADGSGYSPCSAQSIRARRQPW
jgi:hypothetical protein